MIIIWFFGVRNSTKFTVKISLLWNIVYDDGHQEHCNNIITSSQNKGYIICYIVLCYILAQNWKN